MRMRLEIIRKFRHLRDSGPGPMWLASNEADGLEVANESTPSIVARVALGSLAVGLVVLALKAVAAWLTGAGAT